MSNIPDTRTSGHTDTTLQASRASKRLLLLIVIPVILAIAGGLIFLNGGRYVETDNAYIKADKIPISAEVAGIIKEVPVQENQHVDAGQLLFRLDPTPYQMSVTIAEAKLAQVRTDLAAMKASYHEKQAEIKLAQTRLSFSEKDQQRQADLLAKHFISDSQFDNTTQTMDLARQQLAVLNQDLQRIAETLGGNVNLDIEKQPAYRSAQAELDQARLDLARVDIHAPVAGIISKPPKPGQYITAGNVSMVLVANSHLWIEANFTETDLTYVQPGQAVSIKVDTYPDIKLQGVVESLSPATNAEFSILPAQNTTGNWVKVSQRVPVRIKLIDTADIPPLQTGLSTVVEIDTGHRRHLPGFSS